MLEAIASITIPVTAKPIVIHKAVLDFQFIRVTNSINFIHCRDPANKLAGYLLMGKRTN